MHNAHLVFKGGTSLHDASPQHADMQLHLLGKNTILTSSLTGSCRSYYLQKGSSKSKDTMGRWLWAPILAASCEM